VSTTSFGNVASATLRVLKTYTIVWQSQNINQKPACTYINLLYICFKYRKSYHLNLNLWLKPGKTTVSHVVAIIKYVCAFILCKVLIWYSLKLTPRVNTYLSYAVQGSVPERVSSTVPLLARHMVDYRIPWDRSPFSLAKEIEIWETNLVSIRSQ
jgi:uncharacterized membrane protein (DUF485 family)